MAQTIAMQRGTGSVLSGNNLTLFTQSGGLATRVIINMLAWYGIDGQLNTPQVNLIHTSSTGGTNIIGYHKTNTSIWSGQLNPANNSFGPAQYGGNTGSLPVNGILSVNNGANYPGSWSANFMGLLYSSGANTQYVPSNFWIGPSDSIQFSPFDGNTRTWQVAWSFTTITES